MKVKFALPGNGKEFVLSLNYDRHGTELFLYGCSHLGSGSDLNHVLFVPNVVPMKGPRFGFGIGPTRGPRSGFKNYFDVFFSFLFFFHFGLK